MIRIEQDQFDRLIKAYRQDGIPYTLFVSNLSSKVITSMGHTIYTGNPISRKEMGFVNKVRFSLDSLMKTDNRVIPKKYSKAIYFKVNKLEENKVYKNLVEVDINGAYWRTANLLNFISDDLYQKGLFETKNSRLIALGQLAKNQSVFRFNGKSVRRLADICDPKKQYFWDLICKYTGNVLIDISKETDYLFFWVDAIFIPLEQLPIVKQMLREFGYQYKTKKIDTIILSKKQLTVKIKNRVKPKIFNIKSGSDIDVFKQ